MSFQLNTSKSDANTTATGTPVQTSGAGDAAKPAPFSLTPGQNKPGGLFGGLASTPAQSTAFTLGTPIATPGNTAPSQAFGIRYGSSTLATTGATPSAINAAVPTGFPAPTPAGNILGFNQAGTATAITTTATTTSAFAAKPITSAFGVGAGEAVSSGTTTGLTFGTPNTMTVGTTFTLPTATAATTASTLTTTPATGFSLNTSATTSAATPFTFGTSTAATTTTGFSLNKTSAAPSLTTPSTQASLGTATTVTSSASTFQPASISSFEESINKWTLELEEQEKVFVDQAAKVNAWDKLLISNGEKIVALNQEVEIVKIQQQQLEQELDYVVGQQKELQDCLVPLEKELASLSVSDSEREYTYRLAEDLDTQLKRMSEDLKEIIEHLNQANRTQDSSDPIVQIGKILNAHMNSLQWIDQQTVLLNQKIQQIDQMHQNFRQENERTFNLAYN
ncbi:nucleoporin 62 isoform X1 [Megachile rotundata]|uniref:nucleoporin 62 isoform X1 n=1 Tax=Megachile rotundata TaxID=143995 RepID=UPI003FD6BFE4